jgi:chromosomal replication initiator protein
MDRQLSLEIEPSDELSALWSQSLRLTERAVGREAVQSWLKECVPQVLAEGRLTLAVADATTRTWIEKKYLRILEQAVGEVRGAATVVELVVRKADRSSTKTKPAPARVETQAARPAVSPLFSPLPLNEKYTFGNFVVGQSNRFAHAAAAAVAERPGREFNPLFIYGGVGLGKTHLLQAIGHALREQNPRSRVVYISGETFTAHFITSLREHREEEFRRAYRSVDIWLVDDIQFIADKTSTKEEFFHTFNELYLTNKQIVLASDRPPRELRLMEDRLRSRLEAGLMVEIAPPELETRVAILQKRAALEGVDVPSEVLYQIAHSVTSNIRVLEAALIRLLALSSLTRSSVTGELAARAVGAFVQDGGLATIGFVAIMRAVCDHFNVTEQELVGARRDRQTCMARQVAMYLMRELSRKSLVEIGQHFGGKSHSTVLYACAKLEKEMREDPALASTIQGLRSRIAGAGVSK